MGCDIHLVVEAKDDDGKWQFVPGPIIDCWSCKGTGIISPASHPRAKPDWMAENNGKPCYWCNPVRSYTYNPVTEDETECVDPFRNVEPGKVRDEWWSDRHYDIFAILANVRNGRGFAGVPTSDGLPYISNGRGKPDDMTDKTKEWFSLHGGDHSDTWVSLTEVMKYDWTYPVRKTGIVTINEFDTYLRRGAPDGWSGDISGGNVVQVSNEVMTQMIKDGRHKAAVHGYIDSKLYTTRINWVWSTSHIAEAFMERMKMLAMEVGEHECRLIMDFDS
jgi:hypothetical protein